eukprot:TRINITY_DN8035_c0_g1_i10.p1 TRINITY_DN8035_c0_g1~~TRINITY_DN8035_c0_g1_i10.p1  ORF type:complete len:585 (-),score=118.85 TRINITY_DN8035_c0_g1_i10:397-2016(-)
MESDESEPVDICTPEELKGHIHDLDNYLNLKALEWEKNVSKETATRLKFLLNKAMKDIPAKKYKDAESAIWQASLLKECLPTNEYSTEVIRYFGPLLKIIVPLHIEIGKKYGATSDVAMLKSMVLILLDIVENSPSYLLMNTYGFIFSAHLMLSKVYDQEDQQEEGLKHLAVIPESSPVFDYSCIWKAILYFHMDPDHPKIEESLRKIKLDETRATFDFNGFVGDLISRGLKFFIEEQYKRSYKIFKMVQDIYPTGFDQLLHQKVKISDTSPNNPSETDHDLKERVALSTIFINYCNKYNLQKSIAKFYDQRILANVFSANYEDAIQDIIVAMPLMKHKKPQQVKHFCQLFGCLQSLDQLHRIYPIAKDWKLDFRLPILFDVIIKLSLTCVEYKEYDMARMMLKDLKIKGLDSCGIPFDSVVKFCHQLMVDQEMDLALKVADIGLMCYNNGKKKFMWHLIKAKIYRQERNLELAVKTCKHCLNQNPGCADAYFELGMSYFVDKNMDEAKSAFKKCLKKNPEHSNALKALQKIAIQKEDS